VAGALESAGVFCPAVCEDKVRFGSLQLLWRGGPFLEDIDYGPLGQGALTLVSSLIDGEHITAATVVVAVVQVVEMGIVVVVAVVVAAAVPLLLFCLCSAASLLFVWSTTQTQP